jgi:hypothetical protein
MNCYKWLASFLILLALGGCAATGSGQIRYTPYSHDDQELRNGGGEGGGGGGGSGM